MKISVSDFDLESSILSGQSFRQIKEEDGTYTIILKDRVINVCIKNNNLIVKSDNYDNLESIVRWYFDLNRDYTKINNDILKKDPSLKNIVNSCKGYKIFNQPKLETIISYIISQNNSVKNITNSINKICKNYGKEIKYNENSYYLFPDLDKLKALNEEDFKKCGVGFRSKYIINMIYALSNNLSYIENIESLDAESALEELMKIKGIGLKVASCILLFSFGRYDVFPIDTWVKKYFGTNNVNEIKNSAYKRFGNFTGLVLQYFFHYERNVKSYKKETM